MTRLAVKLEPFQAGARPALDAARLPGRGGLLRRWPVAASPRFVSRSCPVSLRARRRRPHRAFPSWPRRDFENGAADRLGARMTRPAGASSPTAGSHGLRARRAWASPARSGRRRPCSVWTGHDVASFELTGRLRCDADPAISRPRHVRRLPLPGPGPFRLRPLRRHRATPSTTSSASSTAPTGSRSTPSRPERPSSG
ncbi:MAG: hypothetical protein M0C28_00460 [Candidatus Moduliflexus flocculans]|nr:hypothetical protein [Candidatus Moduliflexus flocculans]